MPSATPGCELAATLRQVKASVPYDQHAVAFGVINGRRSLAVWYVDPSLEPFPSTSQLQQQLHEARLRAAEVASIVNAASPCSSRTFNVINPIVVDNRYQGWFSGEIRPQDLPTGQVSSQEELARASDRFRVGYLRTSLSHPYKKGTCEWPEALERLQSHFAADRELVAFYFVIDDLGSHVWVHWDGEADLIMEVATLGNISLALECFSPTADVIYVVLAADGRLVDAGVLPPRERE